MKYIRATATTLDSYVHESCEIWATLGSVHISIDGTQVNFHGENAKKLMRFLKRKTTKPNSRRG
jgi:hypothetical protein